MAPPFINCASQTFRPFFLPAILLMRRFFVCVLLGLFLLVPIDASPVLPGPPIFEAISHYPSICYLPPESGICPPAVANRTTDSHNKLITVDVSTVDDRAAEGDGGDDVSQLRHAQQPLLTRYYFDVVTAQCYPFGAQTCGGNENRFETQTQCLAKCRIGND